MKTFPAATAMVNGASLTMKAWLDTRPSVAGAMADLVTVTLVDGVTVYRWTTFPAPLVVSGNTFSPAGSNGPSVERNTFSNASRLRVDTLDIWLRGDGSFTIGGKSLPYQSLSGMFDGARIKIEHLLGPDLPTALTWGPLLNFVGFVGSPEPYGSDVLWHCATDLAKLQQPIPNQVIAPPCCYAVYDKNCGLSAAAFAVAGTASGSPTTTSVPTTTSAITTLGAGYFDLGVLTFTSGALSGQAFDVLVFTGSAFTIALPMPAAPSAGDSFVVYPGCDKTRARCVSPFNNLVKFRGFPNVPNPEAAN